MISYCTNVHPAETVAGIVEQLDRYSVPIREELGADVLGLGLWLPAPAARHLAADPAARRRFRRELDVRGLAVQTLNAFPYRGFHEPVVKHSVYHPRWTEKARLDYTRDCATVLTTLLPDDAEYGSISTLPLGWRTEWTAADDSRATAALSDLTDYLARLPRPIRLAIEPEPGCILDTVSDAVTWLAGRVDPDHIGICLDTCHLAVSFADPAAAVRQITDAGLRVVKVQASAALEAPAGHAAALAPYIEPRYLHQVRAAKNGTIHPSDDLPTAYTTLPRDAPWRVHFHVPLHLTPEPPLTTTTHVLTAALAALPTPTHIEVETYTWPVLPTPSPPTATTHTSPPPVPTATPPTSPNPLPTSPNPVPTATPLTSRNPPHLPETTPTPPKSANPSPLAEPTTTPNTTKGPPPLPGGTTPGQSIAAGVAQSGERGPLWTTRKPEDTPVDDAERRRLIEGIAGELRWAAANLEGVRG